jgi:hypothetical protein
MSEHPHSCAVGFHAVKASICRFPMSRWRPTCASMRSLIPAGIRSSRSCNHGPAAKPVGRAKQGTSRQNSEGPSKQHNNARIWHVLLTTSASLQSWPWQEHLMMFLKQAFKHRACKDAKGTATLVRLHVHLQKETTIRARPCSPATVWPAPPLARTPRPAALLEASQPSAATGAALPGTPPPTPVGWALPECCPGAAHPAAAARPPVQQAGSIGQAAHVVMQDRLYMAPICIVALAARSTAVSGCGAKCFHCTAVGLRMNGSSQ